MSDLLAMAFQADLTRVFTFMMSREGSQRTFSKIGISDPWHVVSHHGDRPEKIASNAKVNVFCLQMFARFAREAAGDAGRRRHAARSLADLLRQRHGATRTCTPPIRCRWSPSAAASARGNRHIVLPKKTQIGNLWLTVANHFGSPTDEVRREHRHGRVLLRCASASRSLVLALAVPARAAGPEPALVARGEDRRHRRRPNPA